MIIFGRILCRQSYNFLRREYTSSSSCFRMSSSMQKIFRINPQQLFTNSDYAVVILNRKIQLEDAFFQKIWNNAAIRQVVDGGANRFFHFLDRQSEDVKNDVKYPDIASGDFDSITDDSMSRLKDQTRSKCKVVVTEDQDETDFSKALMVLKEELKSTESLDKLKSVVIICEFTGRLDHIIGNLNTLHKNVFLEDFSAVQRKVVLMGSETLCWLLPANHKSLITFESDKPNFTCGIVPFQGPTKCTSKGLQWNLTSDMVCQFGSLVSTSNIAVARVLELTSEKYHSVYTIELIAKDYVL